MYAIFSDADMASCCYKESKRTTRPGLDTEKVKLLEGITIIIHH